MSAELGAQLAQRPLQALGRRRVDGDELPAAAPIAVLRVAQEQHQRIAQELEAERARHAVAPGAVEHLGGVVRSGGDVDLPALRDREGRRWGEERPFVAPDDAPSFRQRTAGEEALFSRRRAPRRVVERRIGDAEGLIAKVHVIGSLPQGPCPRSPRPMPTSERFIEADEGQGGRNRDGPRRDRVPPPGSALADPDLHGTRLAVVPEGVGHGEESHRRADPITERRRRIRGDWPQGPRPTSAETSSASASGLGRTTVRVRRRRTAGAWGSRARKIVRSARAGSRAQSAT
jgi:hypothetical protein